MKGQPPYRRPFFPAQSYAHISEELRDHLDLLPKASEGHISPDQAEFLYHFIRLIRPTFVVETGLGAGHSACVIMLAQASVGIEPHLTSVDQCKFPETRTAEELLRTRYKGFALVEGDSKDVLENAVNTQLRLNEGLTLGLGIVDGGHDDETAFKDLEVLASFLEPGGFLWLDDFEKVVPCFGVNMAGREFARKWGHCQSFRTRDHRGFMLYQKAF